jgi:hypothetical protein
MANNIDWGQGIINNTINWGLGAVNNVLSWGISHKEENSRSGETEIYGLSELQRQFKLRVEADGGIVESIRCVKL